MRASPDGTRLGGISVMLEVADVCPQCGRNHSDARTSFRPRGPHDCPSVVLGSYPVLPSVPIELVEIPPSPASRRIQEFERATTLNSSAASASSWGRRDDDARPTRPLAIPWLPLPDLGEVL